MDGVDAGLLGDGDDLGNVQIGGDGGGRLLLLEEEGLVGCPAVLRVAILVAVDGDWFVEMVIWEVEWEIVRRILMRYYNKCMMDAIAEKCCSAK